jgi:glyoxylase-like metal-dependent hydrolase (beta-lactamase superfamily II)
MRARTLACVSLLAIAPPAAQAAADPLVVFAYQSEDVADGIRVFRETRRNPVPSGNIVAVTGDDAVLVFDAGNHPAVTKRIVADIRKMTHKPVRWLVDSHWHDDHWVGNAEFAAAFPGVQVIAHPFTATMMETRRGEFSGAPCRKEMQDAVAPYQQRLAAGRDADGTPLSDEVRARLLAFVDNAQARIAECDSLRFRGVDLAFDHELEVRLGKRVVRLLHLGRGNTAGDVVAYVADAKVLLAGDVVVEPIPYATQAYIGDWSKVLAQIEAMDAVAIVPGHGKVLRGKRYVRELRELFASLDAQVRAAYGSGKPLEQVRKAVDVSASRTAICGDDARLQAAFDYMLDSALQRAYEDVSGTLRPERNE